jgi:ferric-dicitrate binding protein FerR (iron transport regulator)
MDRNAFHALLKKYIEGKCTEEERLIIDKWYELLDDGNPVNEDAIEWNEIEDRLWNKIHSEVIADSAPEKHTNKKVYRIIRWLSVAAIVIVVITSVYLHNSHNQFANSLESEKVQQGLLEETNFADASKQIILEDGSRVILYKNSKIAFPKHFAKDKREVYLAGEAFFTVSKNAVRPFFVYNNNLVAEVLGTSFNVKIINNKIEVAVKTGKVAVYENGNRVSLSAQQKKANGVIVTPNEKVTYYVENRHFVTALVDAPAPVISDTANNKAVEEIKFVFDDTPLADVLQAIEKTYGIEIILENDALKTCPFTGDITKPDLFNKLQFICQVFSASYEIKGTKILIKGGKGCS